MSVTEKVGNHLQEHIKARIVEAGGAISFRDFMEFCLYYPQLGYYQKHLQRTGKTGDFYTSPVVSDVFGQVIAGYIQKMWIACGCPQHFYVIEYGAGTGKLAQSILQELHKNVELYTRIDYVIIEISDDFRQKQQDCLSGHTVTWVDRIEDLGAMEYACVLSNEFVDAMPVHWVVAQSGTLMEKFVTYDQQKQTFAFVLQEADQSLQEYFSEQGVRLRDGQQAEVNLDAKAWLRGCAQSIKNGYILTIDYGYTRDELYAPHRKDGTLLCYYKHTCNEEPLSRIGDQDITSHVNFSQLIQWGEAVELTTVSYVKQSQFLLDGGILDHWNIEAPLSPFAPEYRKNAAIKQLILDQGMGSSFQVLLQKKGIL